MSTFFNSIVNIVENDNRRIWKLTLSLNVHRRPVNNHNKLKQLTNQVGAVLAIENLKPIAPEECAPEAEEVIVQVDGGHLPIQEKNKRSFEALSAVVYRLEQGYFILKMSLSMSSPYLHIRSA